MSRRARRWIVAIVIVTVVGLGALVVFVVVPLLTIATAYSAQRLCSEVFVAGRDVAVATADLTIDDLRPLRTIRTALDQRDGTTTASFYRLFERRARYHGDRGCALESGAHSPAQMAGGRSHPTIEPALVRGDTLATLPPSVRGALDSVLASAFDEPDPSRPRRTRAVIVMQHGKMVAERYAVGIDAETPLPGWSMAKSVLNALVGIAVGEGKLRVNDPVPLRAWSAPGDPRGRISLNDLLHMSSGLQFNEDGDGLSADVLRMLFDTPDMAAFAASRALGAEPGRKWGYASGTSVIVSRVLREALGDQEYLQLPRRALFAPLGMPRAVLEADASGTFVASSYMYATAREWARFGQLYLDDGVWMGKRILPEGWVAYTRTPAPAAPGAIYGAHFWLSTPTEYRGPAVALPAGVYQAVGHEAQFVTIVPSRDVVIVRLGRTRYPRAWQQDRFVAAVLAALGA